MSSALFFPFRVLAWVAAATMAGAVGWKLGTYVAEVATGEREPPWAGICENLESKGPSETLWKRKYDPVA